MSFFVCIAATFLTLASIFPGVLKGGAFGAIDLENYNYNFKANTQPVFGMHRCYDCFQYRTDSCAIVVAIVVTIAITPPSPPIEMMQHSIPHLKEVSISHIFSLPSVLVSNGL
jgi:hypothetical protein